MVILPEYSTITQSGVVDDCPDRRVQLIRIATHGKRQRTFEQSAWIGLLWEYFNASYQNWNRSNNLYGMDPTGMRPTLIQKNNQFLESIQQNAKCFQLCFIHK